jgi:hypothetical protein
LKEARAQADAGRGYGTLDWFELVFAHELTHPAW